MVGTVKVWNLDYCRRPWEENVPCLNLLDMLLRQYHAILLPLLSFETNFQVWRLFTSFFGLLIQITGHYLSHLSFLFFLVFEFGSSFLKWDQKEVKEDSSYAIVGS